MTKLKNSRIFPVFLSILLLLTIQPNISAISIEQEKKARQQFLLDVKKHLNVIDDPYIRDFINDFGKYLAQYVETKHFDFDFYVINEDELNAFAGPGGVVFVYSGLIRVMDEVDELASVICHEIAHVSSRHISQNADKYYKLGLATMVGILAGALIGGDAANAIMTGSIAAGQQKQLAYSREAERQADQVGYNYITKSGFNPMAMKKALMKIQQSRWGMSDFPAYLSTHPLGPERISNIETMLSFPTVIPAKEEVIKFRKTYPLFRTVIMTKYNGNDDMVNYYRSELSKSPDSPLNHFGLALALTRKGNYHESIEHYKTAIKGLAEPLIVYKYLSEAYLLNGQTGEAVSALEKALELSPNDRVILASLAQSYQKDGMYGKAIEFYEKLKYMPSAGNDIFYNLGYSYGKEGKLGLAHYNFGIYHTKVHNMREADFHFNEAKREAGGNPDLLKKIEEALKKLKEQKKKKTGDEIAPPEPGKSWQVRGISRNAG